MFEGEEEQTSLWASEDVPTPEPHNQLLIPGFASVVLTREQRTNRATENARRSLADVFLVPPFTVLDARQGYWQDRKRAWLALGLRGEVGRGDVLPSGEGSVYSGSSDWSGHRGPASNKRYGRTWGQDIMRGEYTVGAPKGERLTWVKGNRKANEALDDTSQRILASGASTSDDPDTPNHSGTSIFDPVLCELAYRWFCPPGGTILDPFAGGPTRGIVAGYLGYPYIGVEVRPEQVAANKDNYETIATHVPFLVSPSWINADSTHLDTALPPDTHCDLIFTCPPYYDLEVYSAGTGDLSAKQSYDEFIYWYGCLFKKALTFLRDDRFVVVVVGEVRDKRGAYRNFVGDTIMVFRRLGLEYYNEAVLITAVGSLPLRVGKQFGKWRKLGKGHQNVLVFYKGDLGEIAKAFPLLGGNT